MSEPKLQPCPFCGERETLCWDNPIDGKFKVWCEECEGSGPWTRTLELAVERWNRRAGSEQQANRS